MAKRYYVTMLSEDRYYGGPQEGGWWYDAGYPVRVARFRTFARARQCALQWQRQESDHDVRMPEGIRAHQLPDAYWAEAEPGQWVRRSYIAVKTIWRTAERYGIGSMASRGQSAMVITRNRPHPGYGLTKPMWE